MTAAPYESNAAHLRDELRRLDVLLRLHLETWWAGGGGEGEFGGLYISDEEIERLLRLSRTVTGDGGHLHPDDRAEDAASWNRFEALSREIRARERATAGTGVELRLAGLVDRFGLDARHRDALVMALAPELERKYEKVYAYLQDDVTRTRPTVELLLGVLCGTAVDRLAAREAFSWESPLVTAGLVHLTSDREAPLPSHSVAVDERIVGYLLGSDALPSDLEDAVTVVAPARRLDDLSVDADRRERLRGLADRGRLLAYFHGPYGSMKDAAVEAVCAERGIGLLRADARKLGGHGDADGSPALADGSRIDRLVREARLRDAAVHVANVAPPGGTGDEEEPPRWSLADRIEALARAFGSFDGPLFVSGERAVSPRVGVRIEDRSFSTLAFAVPPYGRRRELWAAVEGLPPDVDPADLAAKFQLTAGGIEDAVATARTIAGDDDLTAAAVYAACRAQSRDRLGSLAQSVETGYTWEDIVLPPDTMAHLREVAAHVKHRGRVYADWGFEAKYSLGNGLNVLFTGPSGTGKTMAAEIVAGDAGLDLYRIDLASVVSKYIGETEENLKAVFDEAEGSNAVLFFDEADALFGERSEVSDSHDRYANVEVSYLLQRMEDHDGTVVLASNLEENIDDAFRRRLNLSVAFPFPDRDARAAIWRTVFPAETPVEDLDVAFLAGFELAGGNIKNAALTAAFLAAEDDSPVGMEHLVKALRRELQKTGRLVNPEDFGEYRTLLEA